MTVQNADYLLAKAEQCFELAREAERGLKSTADLSKVLSDLGHELMAKAVEVDAARDRARKPS